MNMPLSRPAIVAVDGTYTYEDLDGRVAELWMVEAQPAYSDEFWS